MRCNDPEVLLLLLLLPFFFRVAHWTLADQPRPSCALFQSAGHSSAEESEPCRTLFSSPAGARALLLFLLCRSSFVFCLFFFWRPRQSKTNDQFRRHFWTGSISAGKNLTTQRPRLVRKRRFRTPKRQKKRGTRSSSTGQAGPIRNVR